MVGSRERCILSRHCHVSDIRSLMASQAMEGRDHKTYVYCPADLPLVIILTLIKINCRFVPRINDFIKTKLGVCEITVNHVELGM